MRNLVLLALLFSSSAWAVPRHEAVTVTPKKVNGQIVGAKIKMRLINDHSSRFEHAYVALVDPKNTPIITRPQAVNASMGMLVHQFAPEAGIKQGTPREVEFEIIYGQGNNLKSGQHLNLLSAWPGFNTELNNPHVFGAVLGASRPAGHQGDIQLP